ncbi:hypothetical protein GOODEAATRI_003287 [Goodea atripinnis]|uniref:Uncharacterized protein n=1 Tax=Goodea atripinnis TaxID=208336 RepID=A0ABV0P199_9TELE
MSSPGPPAGRQIIGSYVTGLLSSYVAGLLIACPYVAGLLIACPYVAGLLIASPYVAGLLIAGSAGDSLRAGRLNSWPPPPTLVGCLFCFMSYLLVFLLYYLV